MPNLKAAGTAAVFAVQGDVMSISRRGLLIGAGSAAALALAGCGGDEDSPTVEANENQGPWEFTDDRGQKVTRDARPQRVVGYVSSAAALWDYGTHVVGAFGPQKTTSGQKELQAGNIDVNTVQSVGNAWDDFNLEKFAALRPDLVVNGLTGTRPTDMWVFTDQALLDKVQQIAPVVALSEYKVILPKVIERYAQLAQSLGADIGSAQVIAAKADFQQASEELRRAAAEKAGLKVMAVSSDKDGIFVTKPEFFADLAYYKELGLDLVSGGGSEDYWETLSWEQVAKYPADLILTDTRTYALSQQELAEHPTWKQLPAVRAGQLGAWSAEPRFNYQLAAPVIRQLAGVVQKAEKRLS
jgi:iron complex transport system substrate-binding protein